jgi:hypothetical protein
VIAVGVLLAIASAVAINGGYALQHGAASRLPPLSLRRPLASSRSLLAERAWLAGFLGGIAGWVLYVVALRIAPLSIVQAAAAGGIGVLALGGRLSSPERIAVGAALAGLALLGTSLTAHLLTERGDTTAIVIWMLASLAAVPVVIRALPPGAGFGTAAGILYAAGDVGTKAAVVGGERLWFVPGLLACHGLAFVCMQLAFQRGARLATAGLALLWTNALPIVAGSVVFGEGIPGGWRGAARVAAFALVLVSAAGLSRPAEAASPAVAGVATISID